MKTDKPTSCECCHYDTPELEAYDQHQIAGPSIRRWFCILCASSLASNAVTTPGAYADGAGFLAGVIMNAANHIIAEIRKQRSSREN